MEHTDIGGISDLNGEPLVMCLPGNGQVYFEGGTLDLEGIGQLQVALDQAATLIRQAAGDA